MVEVTASMSARGALILGRILAGRAGNLHVEFDMPMARQSPERRYDPRGRNVSTDAARSRGSRALRWNVLSAT